MAMPPFEFCIPTTGTKVPSGPEWLHDSLACAVVKPLPFAGVIRTDKSLWGQRCLNVLDLI